MQGMYGSKDLRGFGVNEILIVAAKLSCSGLVGIMQIKLLKQP